MSRPTEDKAEAVALLRRWHKTKQELSLTVFNDEPQRVKKVLHELSDRRMLFTDGTWFDYSQLRTNPYGGEQVHFYLPGTQQEATLVKWKESHAKPAK